MLKLYGWFIIKTIEGKVVSDFRKDPVLDK